MTPTTSSFVRDRFTWLAYFMLAYYAYLQASLGPLMPFLSDELDLNFTVSGFHLSAFAVGMVLAGLGGDAIAARIGRRTALWGGGLGMALGSLLLIIGTSPIVTIAGTLIMGTIGSLLLVMVQATLSDRHLERRASALTEANIAASIFAAFAPVMIGLGQILGTGWRTAIVAGVALWLILFFVFRDAPLPAEVEDNAPLSGQKQSKKPLPSTIWAYWMVIFLSVSIEWCIVFWGASFLEIEVGLRKVDASTTMSAFFIAMIVGRVIGSRLTSIARSVTLLLLAVSLVLIGFPLFWLANETALNVIGLFLVGLGVANLFPLTLSAASNAAPTQSNKVSARISLGAGTAILITPQILGSLADQHGIAGAFVIVGIFAIVVAALVAMTYVITHPSRRKVSHES